MLLFSLFLAELDVLGLSLFSTMALPILLLVFFGTILLCFGRTGGDVIFLRGMLSSLEEMGLDSGPFLCKL
jgi:hypothetical protein